MQKSFFSRLLVFFKHWFFLSVFIFIFTYYELIGNLLSSWMLDMTFWQMAIDASVIILIATFFFVVLFIPPAIPSRPKVHLALSRISAFTASAVFILFTLRAFILWLLQKDLTIRFLKTFDIQFTIGLNAKIFLALAVLIVVSALMRLQSCEPLRIIIGQGMERLLKVSVGVVAGAFIFFLLSFFVFVLFSGDSQPIVHPSFKPKGAVRNVLLITFDSLAAQDMSLYGYRLDTTPKISKFAQSAVVFDRFYAQSNWTFPTTTSLLTGTYPSGHRNYTYPYRYPRLTHPQNVLQRILKEHGFYTAAASSNANYGSPESTGTDFGFDTIADKKHMVDWATMLKTMPFLALATYGQNHYTKVFATCYYGFIEPLLEQYFVQRDNLYPIGPVLKYAEGLMLAKPFFMWIHLFPPHIPYFPPVPHRDLYCKGSCSATHADARRLLFKGYPPDQQKVVDELRLRYDEYIHYCDAEIGFWIESLKRQGMLEDTMFILSSDHGESFEDGHFGHGGPLLRNQLIQVPCVIHMPGMQGTRLSVNAEQIDLAPTILDALGIEKPGWMQGESLLPYMLGQKDRTDKPKYAMQFQGNGRFDKKISKGTVAVMLGSFKLIYNVATDKAQLYDLEKDPREQNDISGSNPEEVKHLKTLIKKDIFHSESPAA